MDAHLMMKTAAVLAAALCATGAGVLAAGLQLAAVTDRGRQQR